MCTQHTTHAHLGIFLSALALLAAALPNWRLRTVLDSPKPSRFQETPGHEGLQNLHVSTFFILQLQRVLTGKQQIR